MTNSTATTGSGCVGPEAQTPNAPREGSSSLSSARSASQAGYGLTAPVTAVVPPPGPLGGPAGRDPRVPGALGVPAAVGPHVLVTVPPVVPRRPEVPGPQGAPLLDAEGGRRVGRVEVEGALVLLDAAGRGGGRRGRVRRLFGGDGGGGVAAARGV